MTFDPYADSRTTTSAIPAAAPDTGPARIPRSSRRPRRIGLTAVLALCAASALAGSAVTLGATSVGVGPGTSEAVTVTGATAPDQAPRYQSAAVPGVVDPAAVAAVNGGGSAVISEVARDLGPSVVAIVTGTADSAGTPSLLSPAAGSGVIVDSSGLILTNRHVVGDNSSVMVYLADGREFTGTVEGVDTLTDLALLSIDTTDLPAATLGDSSSVQVGDLAVAIGNPQGNLPGSVTAGIISALERQIVVGDVTGRQAPEALQHLIQHDAAINPGNSGGPLIAADGTVIAINTAMAGGAQGIGFAIPIDLARPIVRQVLAGDPIQRPYIGIFFTEIDAQLARDERLAADSGVLVRGDTRVGQPGVIPNGPADMAGLKDGDILTQIDGQTIDAAHQLDVALLQHEPGETVKLTVLRGDRTMLRDVSLGVRPADSAQ